MKECLILQCSNQITLKLSRTICLENLQKVSLLRLNFVAWSQFPKGKIASKNKKFFSAYLKKIDGFWMIKWQLIQEGERSETFNLYQLKLACACMCIHELRKNSVSFSMLKVDWNGIFLYTPKKIVFIRNRLSFQTRHEPWFDKEKRKSLSLPKKSPRPRNWYTILPNKDNSERIGNYVITRQFSSQLYQRKIAGAQSTKSENQPKAPASKYQRTVSMIYNYGPRK